ncbi:MAG: type IV pili twitching motility protein PilT, partial [bacterium]
IDVFPPHQQEQVRRQVSLVLEGVICQRLLPKLDSCGLVAATEVLIPSAGIRNLIRDKKDHQIYSLIQTGQEKFGMHTMNQSLIGLLAKGVIHCNAAVSESPDPSELIEMMNFKGISRSRPDACLRI